MGVEEMEESKEKKYVGKGKTERGEEERNNYRKELLEKRSLGGSLYTKNVTFGINVHSAMKDSINAP